jgi:hypothetical protein
VRLYTALRRLRVEAWFLDLLHEPRASTEAYNRSRLAELGEWLGAGDPAEAIRAANRAREAGERARPATGSPRSGARERFAARRR